MRADAARNVEGVLLTAARVLAANPAASIAEIAREAGVDRSTVYRRFPTRDALLGAVHTAKLDAAERAIEDARPQAAPFTIAVHRFIENTVVVSRQWPVDLRLLMEDEQHRARAEELRGRVEGLVERGIEEQLVRSGQPEGWACDVLLTLLDLATHQHEELAPGAAADLVTEAFLGATGSGGPA